MTAIAGRLGEFWAAFEGGTPVVPASGSATNATSQFAPDQVDNATLANPGLPTGALVDITMNGNVDELETTVHNNDVAAPVHSTARTYIPNFHDETLDCSLRYDEADAISMGLLVCALNSFLFHFWYVPDGEAFIMSATPANISVAIRGTPPGQGTVGANAFYGKAFSTGFPVGSPLDDTATFDVTLRLSGTNIVTLTT